MRSGASPSRALFLDLDGTLYFKGEAIPGAVDAVHQMRADGAVIRMLSNTDSLATATLRKRIQAMGFEVGADEVFTAASAAVRYLREQGAKRCCCVVSRDLLADFREFEATEGDIEYVVVGDCRETLSYELLNRAFRALFGGAKLLALQKGRYFHSPDGPSLDSGAVVAALEYAADTISEVAGKPTPFFFGQALRDCGLPPERVVVVGDDITTDIAGARRMHLRSVLVRTGKFDPSALANSPHQPEEVIDSVADLPALLARLSP